ncbi:cell wall assembly protein [Bacillus sp. AFS077874]|uniref:SMI1/KNR4 family protein n=1 Tax=unclassified Bacillus (in: firmicutes) TaxID=185979 RepID=UPI000BECE876|nr:MULTISPECIES: SMI1/KNR4 family protein [unclassified Bacillus (in: firmicutes)]PEC48811.1 cell wall assembly protein [Bacillus sp. AFS096315]PFM82831.1 cell wall assembly protein [Bacillus sp. AFS077874]
MSWSNYEKAIEIIEQNQEESDFVGKRSESLIEKAETTLGLKFSKIYRHFLINYGAGDFGSEEVYGVIDDDFINSSVPDAIWYTIKQRKNTGLPENYLIIYATGMGELFCLDFNKLNRENEPAVVSINLGKEFSDQSIELIADDFGDFLLEIIQDELEFIQEELE